MRRSLINERAPKPIKYKAEPTISCFHHSEAFVRCIRGPIGSGKTVGCCWEIFKKGLEQKPFNKVRSTRWALIRNTYGELRSTTIKTWFDWFDRYTSIVYSKPIEAKCSLTLKDGTTVNIELFFIALDRPDDVRKLKGLELTGAYLNEICEIDYAVLDMSTGRVLRYPPKFKGGFTWSGVIGDTNSMDDDHWYYEKSEENVPETWEFFTQPAALLRVEEKDAHKIPKGEPTVSIREGKVIYIYYPNPAAENYEGQSIGVHYWLKMLPGKAQNWINIFVLNKYGTITTGRPVYPEYDDDVHCPKEDIIPSKKFGLIFGWDWGLTPAFAVMQLSNNRLDIIEEIYVPSHAGMGVRQFITQIIKPHVLKHYQWWIERRLIQSGGDPAGTIRSQTDELTCITVANSIFEKEHIVTVEAFTNATLARLDAVQRFLIDFPDGNPAFRLSPKCKHLRKGFRGRWVYERIQASGKERYRDKPDKTTYSHIQEAVQYGAMIAYEQAYGEKPKLSKYDKRIDELEKTAKNDHVSWASKAQQAAVRDLTRQDLIDTITDQ